MKSRLLILFVILALLASGCTPARPARPQDAPPPARLTQAASKPPKQPPAEPSLPPPTEAAPEPTQPPAEAPQAMAPEAVVQMIFASAQSGNFAPLAALCDPQKENDGDTQMICDVATQEKDRASFVEYFSKGNVNGPAVISADGTRAEVPFLFGPDGAQQETMVLVNRAGQWYLLEF